MTDIDFDELDRAVSSLMTEHQASRPSKDTPPRSQADDDTVIELDIDLDTPKPELSRSDNALDQPQLASPAATDKPKAEAEDTVDVELPADTVKLTPETKLLEAETEHDDEVTDVSDEDVQVVPARVNLPSRRSGRFMDVVHPSSDMRNESSSTRPVTQPPKPPVSRTGITLDPNFSQASASSPADDRPVLDSVVSPSVDLTDNLAASNEPVAMNSGFDMEDTLQTELDKDDTYDNQISNTPFLTDAKVEKRPLGGVNPPAADTEDVAEPGSPEANDGYQSQAQQDDTQTAPNRVVQAELRNDLISLESDETASSPEVDDAESPKIDQPKERVPEPREDTSPVESTPHQPATAAPVQPTGPIAITQQYKEEPSSSPTESGSIYDTSDYHQPLAHPAKKSSGWMWVIWVLVLLVLGAGSGAAAYFLLIQ